MKYHQASMILAFCAASAVSALPLVKPLSKTYAGTEAGLLVRGLTEESFPAVSIRAVLSNDERAALVASGASSADIAAIESHLADEDIEDEDAIEAEKREVLSARRDLTDAERADLLENGASDEDIAYIQAGIVTEEMPADMNMAMSMPADMPMTKRREMTDSERAGLLENGASDADVAAIEAGLITEEMPADMSMSMPVDMPMAKRCEMTDSERADLLENGASDADVAAIEAGLATEEMPADMGMNMPMI